MIEVFIMLLLFIFIENRTVYNYRVLKGYIKCIDKDLHVKCEFKNIYWINNRWILYSNTHKNYNYCINTYAKKLGECWKVDIYSLNQNINKNIHIDNVFNGLSVPFRLTYSTNYGHAFWDDLYSIYASIVKFGYMNNSFNLIFNKNYKNTRYLNDVLYTLQKFSKGINVHLNKYKNNTILFKTLIVGSSHQCQRCVTLDYSLKYSREYNVTKLLRNRMYEVFNIKPSYNIPIEGIIVHNKRYDQYETGILKNIVTYYRNNNYVRLYYIDYRNISSFIEQLNLLRKIHIYISGPGTGLLNFPFISDPGIVIHLGHIHFGCPQYLEQYMLEGSPHYKAFYYSPQRRMKKLNFSYIIDIINESVKYILNHKVIYVKKEENLNEIGKLYTKICSDHKTLCEKLLKYYDWGYGKCRGIWAENVVFFPSLYSKLPELKEIVKEYNYSNNLGCNVGINKSKQKQCKHK